MGNTSKIVVAAVAGYFLGRSKKLKLAAGLGLWYGARKLDINPQRLVTDVGAKLANSRIVDQLRGQARDQLLTVGKEAAGTLLSRWTESMADSLNERTQRLQGSAGALTEEGEGNEESPPEGETAGEGEPAQKAQTSETEEGTPERGPSGESAHEETESRREERPRTQARSARRPVTSGKRARDAGGRTAKATSKTAARKATRSRGRRSDGDGGDERG